MTKIERIDTYSELLEEKERLMALAKVQRQIIRDDFAELKEEIQPVRNAINMAGKFFKPDTSNPILSFGTNKAIDFLLRKVVLSRAGWITKLVVPFLMKNYSSHFVDEKKGQLAGWAASLLRKFQKKMNGQEEENPINNWDEFPEQEKPIK